MIYYYVKNKDNYLKDGWSELPEHYSEINADVQQFQFNKHFVPVYEIPQERFVVLLDLRHRLVAQHLKHYTIPQETHDAIKSNRCKILLFGWMENWSDAEFQEIYSTLKIKHNWLEQKNFVYVSCSLEDFNGKEYTHIYANKMEWQWHECNYKKVERNSKDNRFQPTMRFICLNRRPAWHRFLTVSRLFDYKRFGFLTHLSPESLYPDYQYGYKTAKRHYDDHYELFKSMELAQEPEFIAPPPADESDYTGPRHIEDLNDPMYVNLMDRRADYVYKTMDFAHNFICSKRPEAVIEIARILWPKGQEDQKYGDQNNDFQHNINAYFRSHGFHSNYKEEDHQQMLWFWKRESTGEIFRARTKEDALKIKKQQLDAPTPPKKKKEGLLAKIWKKKVEKELPMIIKYDKHKIHSGDNPNKDVDSAKYLKSMVHVITETTAQDDQDLFVSEKTFKPMFYKRPFLVAGQKGLYKKLHTLGYKTFPTMFNENFDNITGNWRRVDEVCNEAVKWVKKSDEQCKILFEESKVICDSNFENLMERGANAEKSLHDSIMETF